MTTDRVISMEERFRELRKMQEEMNRVFEGFWSNEKRFLLGKQNYSMIPRVPLTDIQQAGNNVLLRLELPGVEKKDLKIVAKESSIEVSAERKSESKVVKKGYLKRERGYSRFHRLLSLPSSIDVNSVRSDLKDGVLTITAKKKKAKEKSKRILLR